MEPCVADLGCADVSRQLTAATHGHGTWAFATHDASGKTAQSYVSILDTGCGNAKQRQDMKALLEDDEVEQDSKKADKQKEKAKKPKKTEDKGKKPSSGKSAHGRNSGG